MYRKFRKIYDFYDRHFSYNTLLGIDSCLGVSTNHKQLFSNADRELYWAKRRGKNRYALYENNLNHFSGHTCNRAGDRQKR